MHVAGSWKVSYPVAAGSDLGTIPMAARTSARLRFAVRRLRASGCGLSGLAAALPSARLPGSSSCAGMSR